MKVNTFKIIMKLKILNLFFLFCCTLFLVPSISFLAKNFKQLESEIKNKVKEVNELQSKIEKREKVIKKADKKIKSLSKKIKTQNKKLKTNTKNFKDVFQKEQLLLKFMQQKEASYESAYLVYFAPRSESEKLQGMKASAEYMKNEFSRKLRVMTQEKNRLQDIKTSLEHDKTDIKDNEEKLKSETKSMKAELKDQNEKIDTLKQEALKVNPKIAGGKLVTSENMKDILKAAGIAEADYEYVNFIISRESGWRATASNGASGAYGLCQALPGSKMASMGSDWQTNPITQLKWCSGYAKGRYGSWSGAVNFWRQHHWW